MNRRDQPKAILSSSEITHWLAVYKEGDREAIEACSHRCTTSCIGRRCGLSAANAPATLSSQLRW